jgi:hypothetical protein
MTDTTMNTGAASLSDEQIEALKAAALAATPQNIDSAQRIERYEDGSFISCPACGGEGNVELNADFCNYDGEALGVQFYGIGNAHVLAEAYFRAAKPATVLALIERLERAEATPIPQADAAPSGAMTRKDVQGKAIEHGFQYWRAPDAHGVTGTKPQAIELLQDLLGVEVEIEDNGCQTCNGTGMIGGPSYYAPDEGGEPCPDCAAIAAGGAQEPVNLARYQWLRRRAVMVDYSDETVTKLTLFKDEGPTGEFLDDWIDGEIAAESTGAPK